MHFITAPATRSPPTLEDNALEVYFNVSTDHGATWGNDTRIDDGPGPLGTPGYIHLWSPFLGCGDNGRFYAGWQDGREFNNESRPNYGTHWWEDGYCTRTLDTGSTWNANTRINSWDGNYPRCAQPMSANDQSGNVCVAWYSTIEQPTNYNVIRFNRSTDWGTTWKTETRLDHALPSASEWSPQVKCDESGHVYAAWQSSGRKQVRFNTSSDYGETWQSDDIRVDTDSVSGDSKNPPALAADQTGNVYAAWSVWTDSKIYFNRSTDHGMTWGASDIRIDSMGVLPFGGPEYGPQLACTTDGMVYAVWEDKRNGGAWDVFFNRSTDFGATWGTDTRLDTGLPGSATSFRPQLACDARGWVYVAWEDWRQGDGSPHIYMNYSADRGGTWLDADFQVDTGTPVYRAVWPRLLADPSGNIYLGWGHHENTWPEEVYDFHFNHAFATSPIPATSPTPTPSATPSPSPTASPTPKPSATSTASPKPTSTATAVPSPSQTPTPSPSATPSSSPTPSPSPTANPSATPTPTASPTPKPVSPTPSPAPTSSPSPSPLSPRRRALERTQPHPRLLRTQRRPARPRGL
ncbi:MAG: exo-alpha-sialidase [Candidatus Aureabacteria bacterium]|nr:exo-alpha-sialidase [Candidatus Auribacterota bacterium]